MNMVDVLYSLVDVTQRYNQLIFDPFYIRNLNLTSMTMKSFYDRIYSIDSQVLDRICKNILPRIFHQINKLIVEQYSMERVLYTIKYPELYSLTLMDFSEEVLFNYLTNARSTHCTFDLSSINAKSSTLTTLKINVKTFDNCLYLLDGRFNCLSTLIIYVEIISSTSGTIDNIKKLPKLKHFSLLTYRHIFLYDDLIIPLLQRMINLEELILYLSIIRNNKNYIDGNQLYDDILVFMPRLNKFIFNIYTNVDKSNVGTVFSSNEDIQHSFRRKEYGLISSYVENYTTENIRNCHIYSLPYEFKSRCHIYSLPYQFKNLLLLNNSFQGGMFDNVRSLLYIINEEPQKNKQESLPPVKFSHLIHLGLNGSHTDYAEQFLVDKRCDLPFLLSLLIDYESLDLVTNNFTNDATRLTCSKLTSLHLKKPFVPPKIFYEYFPLL
ncbi:unnamed protein product [Adineta steineri]|uniref:Uncharacterized protein n=1 Tax=Adineta steineri TaxID=433720 RepID=A0A814MZK4_9BILA|nr:unnamed protein product [Adineta steineri]CAF1218436.1 unnamed protein product [Adineta steineri]